MNRKTIFLKFFALILSIGILVTSVSCSKTHPNSSITTVTNISTTIMVDNPNDAATCFLLGKTANVKIPNTSLIRDELYQLSEDAQSYRVVILDGKPNEIDCQDTVYFPKRVFNQKENNKKIIQSHLDRIMNLMPDDEEIDILEGLESGKKALSDSKSQKRIVIFSSGISTIGELNFVKNPDWIEKRPTEIIEKLKANYSLPDLSGIDLVWHGFGDVSEPQEDLTKFNEYRLKNLWIEILKACNVDEPEKVFIDSLPIKDNGDYNNSEIVYPKVTPVKFTSKIDITEEEIGFIANQASFRNERVAIESLKHYAECIKNSNSCFYIIGSTATFGDPQKCLVLSEKRANAVKRILCDNYGIPEEQLQIYALGQNNLGGNYEWRCNDLNEDGSLNEEIAHKNRKVMVIDSNSEDGIKFLQAWKSN